MAALLASIVLYAVARPRIAAGDPRAEMARAAGVGPGRRSGAAHEAHRRALAGDGRRRLRSRRLAARDAARCREPHRGPGAGRASGRGLVLRTQPHRVRLLPASRASRPPRHVQHAAGRAWARRLPARSAGDLVRPPAASPGSAAFGLGEHLRDGLVRRPPLLPAARRRPRAPSGYAHAAAGAAADAGLRDRARTRPAARVALARRHRHPAPAHDGPHRSRATPSSRGETRGSPSSRGRRSWR